PGLVHVERLPLREVRDDVDEDDVRVVAPRELLRTRCADVAGADDRHLAPPAPRARQLSPANLHQTRTPSLSMIASATSLVPTAVGSSLLGFMSYVTERPSAITSAIAVSSRSAASSSPRCRSISTPD